MCAVSGQARGTDTGETSDDVDASCLGVAIVGVRNTFIDICEGKKWPAFSSIMGRTDWVSRATCEVPTLTGFQKHRQGTKTYCANCRMEITWRKRRMSSRGGGWLRLKPHIEVRFKRMWFPIGRMFFSKSKFLAQGELKEEVWYRFVQKLTLQNRIHILVRPYPVSVPYPGHILAISLTSLWPGYGQGMAHLPGMAWPGYVFGFAV